MAIDGTEPKLLYSTLSLATSAHISKPYGNAVILHTIYNRKVVQTTALWALSRAWLQILLDWQGIFSHHKGQLHDTLWLQGREAQFFPQQACGKDRTHLGMLVSETVWYLLREVNVVRGQRYGGRCQFPVHQLDAEPAFQSQKKWREGINPWH